jgi:hypothetical protein
LASSTKKRDGKSASSLGLIIFFNVVIIVIYFARAVPHPRVFDN